MIAAATATSYEPVHEPAPTMTPATTPPQQERKTKMGDIAARRETSLTALAAVLGNDMRSEKLWMRRWQTFGITHPHNPCQKTMISGLDGLMAQAARRYAQYESAGWATAAEWASVGGETDDTALGLVLVANTHRCCDDYYCENNSCGQPKQLHLSHRTVINRSQLTNTIDLAEPPDRIPNWTTEKIINLYDGLADDWMFTTNACMSNGKTVHSPSLKHCENTAEFNSNATRAHIMWCLPRCQQTNRRSNRFRIRTRLRTRNPVHSQQTRLRMRSRRLADVQAMAQRVTIPHRLDDTSINSNSRFSSRFVPHPNNHW